MRLPQRHPEDTTPRAGRPKAIVRLLLGAGLLGLVALTNPGFGLDAPGGPEPALAGAGADSVQLTAADDRGRYVYLIEFAEPGLLRRVARAPRERFDPNTPEASAGLAQIVTEQAAHVQAMGSALRRQPEVTHHFTATHSGLAARLTPDEAELVRALPGVTSVEREPLYELDTYRGPAFIGADTIWNGSAVPGGVGTRGAGMVIGMLDSGVASTHPAFANDVACGHGTGGAPNKLISFLDCATTDGLGLCNGPSPEDADGHGSHTASTSGGNSLDSSSVPPPLLDISGVAPCAHIRAYKVCPLTTCPGANIQAGMTSVLLHGDVDVMSFSISGGTSPWIDNDRRKLDLVDAGVLVTASAGNTSATIPNPVGQVGHRGPWVLTVAASTHDGTSGLLSASGPGTPPADTQNLIATRGNSSPVGVPLVSHPILHYTAQDPAMEGCTPGEDGVPPGANPFPPGFFSGTAALIHRGTCAFTKKVTNAFNAGANWVLVRNNQAAPLSMATPGQPPIPAYSIEQVGGNALVAFVDANPGTATFDFLPKGDTLAGFSFRGPTPAPLEDLTKPDVTAPGVSIYAAVPVAVDPSGYAGISGTSMSTPHTAGAATLIRDIHPSWTVPEVKSALMMTAWTDGTKENGTTPWDTDDVGSGRVDLTQAARAGLVLDETFANYLAANPASGGDVKTLNLPAVRNTSCSPHCNWTRTVRNTLGVPTSWTATAISSHPDLGITVGPPTFAFTGGLAETQVLVIRATPYADLSTAVVFGEVILSEIGGLSPDLRITLAIRGTGSADIFDDDFESSDTGAWSLCVGCPPWHRRARQSREAPCWGSWRGAFSRGARSGPRTGETSRAGALPAGVQPRGQARSFHPRGDSVPG